MDKELIVKKCMNCGAYVKVLQDCKCANCGINCCNKLMQTLSSNSTDAAFEKHVPTYEVIGDVMKITVNHVMDEDHYIEWVTILSDEGEFTKYFKPGDVCEFEYKYIRNAKIYAYCNKHNLWMNTVN